VVPAGGTTIRRQTPDAIERGYGGCVDGTEPGAVFIARRGIDAVGLIRR